MNLVGKKFWKYRIEGILGTGGTATVYSAIDERDEKSVAIKILPEGIDRNQLQRFKQETKVLSQLDHPNIIKIFDIGSSEGLHFYVMENRPSRTLREIMDERFAPGGKGFTVEEILAVARDVTEALRCSHAKRIYHRDIKPSNILITPPFVSVVCDFGLAKVSDDKTLTQVGTLMGTPLYMSPEQLQGGEIDARSDVYQLGLLLYQMATGHVPFAGDNPYVAATRRLHEVVPPPTAERPDLPGGLEQILLRCLERDRTRRYQSAGALMDELNRITSRRLLAAKEMEKTVMHAGKVIKSAPALLAVALLCCLLALAAWYAVTGARTELVVSEFALIPGRDEAAVSFVTNRPLKSEVIFGDAEEMDRRRVLSVDPATNHRTSLTGLIPGHRYYLQIRLLLETDRMKALPVREFVTLPSR